MIRPLFFLAFCFLCASYATGAHALVTNQNQPQAAATDPISRLLQDTQGVSPELLQLSRDSAEARRPEFDKMRDKIFAQSLKNIPGDVSGPYLQLLQNTISTDELIDIYTRLQIRHLSPDELKEMKKLVATPIGRKLLADLPGLSIDMQNTLDYYLTNAIHQLIDTPFIQKALKSPARRPTGRPSAE